MDYYEEVLKMLKVAQEENEPLAYGPLLNALAFGLATCLIEATDSTDHMEDLMERTFGAICDHAFSSNSLEHWEPDSREVH